MKKKENNTLTTFRLGLLTLAISAFCLFNITQSAKNIVYQDQFSSPESSKTTGDQKFVDIPHIFPEVITITTPVIEEASVDKIIKVDQPKKEINKKSVKKIIVKKAVKRKTAALPRESKSKKSAYSHKISNLKIQLLDKSNGRSRKIAINYRVLANSASSIKQYERNHSVISTYLANQTPIQVDSIFVSSKEKSKIEKQVLASINKFLPPKSKINRVLISRFIR